MINVNQITSQLAKMPDPMLQKYAAMHKDDPYTVALALSESNRRKAMRVGASPMPGEQPKVVDQDIAEMAAPTQQIPQQAPQQMTQQQLPENVGIGQLPAPNMQRMADGGIVGYAEGGSVPGYAAGTKVNDYVQQYAQEYNVDPALLTQIVSVESGKQGAEAKNPKSSAHGLGQLVDTMWGKMGGGNRKDPETQVRNAAKLLRRNTDSFVTATGREPTPSESYTTWVLGDSTGRAVLKADPSTPVADVIKKASPKLADKIMSSNKEILVGKNAGDVVKWADNKMISVAAPTIASGLAPAVASSAAPTVTPTVTRAPAQQPTGLAQIPTGGVPGAGPTAPGPDTRSYFGKVADDLGISEETQRNINNTLSALGGWTAPASGVSKGVGVASKGLAATPEMLAKAEQLKNATALTRLAPPAAKGIEALAPEAQAMRGAAEEARRVRQMAEDVNAAKAAEQSVKAADITANVARGNEQALAAQQQARMLDSAKLANVGRATTGMQAIDAIQPAPSAKGLPMDDLGYDPSGLEALNSAARSEKGALDGAISTAAKDAGVKPSKFKDDMALMFFLNLMGGKSPNPLTNVSTSGIGALKYGQELKKEESEQLYREAFGKKYGTPSEIQMLEYLKDPKNMANYMQQREAMREPMTKEALYKLFMASPQAMAEPDPEKLGKSFQNFVSTYENQFGPLGGKLPAGVRVSRAGT